MLIPYSPALRGNRGMTLAVVLIFGLLLVGMAGGLVMVARQQTTDRARYETYKDEFAACEVALNKAYAQMQFLKSYHAADFEVQMASIRPPVVAGYEFTQFTATKIFEGREAVASGHWKGLTLYRIRYRIDVTALKHGNTADRQQHPGVTLRQTIELTYIPLYVFAIFYDPLMEIAPGAAMQVNGRVHANGDAYFQSNSGLDFLASVSIAGKALHGRAPGSGQADTGGDVRFSDDHSQLLTMKRTDADGWLTHADDDWGAAAQERWGNGLADSAQGVTSLSLPIPDTLDPHDIIERSDGGDPQALADEKFENKAGLKIVVQSNGAVKGYNAAGVEVPLTYEIDGTTYQVAETTSFYDAREGKTVNSVDIDLGNLSASGQSPANGVVYVANEQGGNNYNAVRLVNGATLPNSSVGGFTVASENPVYIQGDYNTVNQKLAMVAADALSVLSNNWSDANSSTYSKRKATKTTVNCVCMQGIVATAGGNYSGGVENYFRLLEQWSGVELKFSGSIINMWLSEQALGIWRQSGNYYTPPNRNWSWDTALGGLSGPPGAPCVIELRRTAWEMPAKS
ncbi:hypothetical protein LLG95_16400 [bacterium]|nr:hypothetical protein [bacterium]